MTNLSPLSVCETPCVSGGKYMFKWTVKSQQQGDSSDCFTLFIFLGMYRGRLFYVWDHLCFKNSAPPFRPVRMGVCRPPSLWGRSCRLYSSSLRWHLATKSASPSLFLLPWAGLPAVALAAPLEGVFREPGWKPPPAAPTPPPPPPQPPDTVIWLWTQRRGAQGERLLMGTDRTWGKKKTEQRKTEEGWGVRGGPDDEGLICPLVLMVFHLPCVCEWSRLMVDKG